jgi:hypothetical protein
LKNPFKSCVLAVAVLFGCQNTDKLTTIGNDWPEASNVTRPWTRWWWLGSAVSKEGITHELEEFKKAGIGGVEITPIYGVYGKEDQFVTFLSDDWVELLVHTLKEAQRLGLGVDMATGTGWPFGGPWVSEDDACKNLRYNVYEVANESTVPKKIEFIQKPMLRSVGFNVPGHVQFGKPDIAEIKDPITSNKNLQQLAIDQVQFERRLPLKALMAYNKTGQVLDLTTNVDKNGNLLWKFPGGEWKLYAVFQGWHGKMVERAGPGGEGNVIDHFSKQALNHYLTKFDEALDGKSLQGLRAYFNDSYEVDDAQGTANWTPDLFSEFEKRRGYDLRLYLPQLLSSDTSEMAERILCDYRETISELIHHNFTKPWKEWAHKQNKLVRNQAHGSPSNILDLYAEVDIPEIEGTEPLRIKMASSSSNVTGKNLTSAEAATWLDEHFQSNLGDVKVALDRFMLHGINHLVYHGTAYSPKDEPWPGWLFYAAVHFNSRNPEWKNFATLNNYVSRCQSFLQNSLPDNDVLLYYPIYDRFSTRGREMIEHFDGIGRQFEGSSFARCADTLLSNGYMFDYISDKQLKTLNFNNNALVTEGNATYKTLIVPHCRYIPLQTIEKIYDFALKGAKVIFFEGLPESISGYSNAQRNKQAYEEIKDKLAKGSFEHVAIGDEIKTLLSQTNAQPEPMFQKDIYCLRKKTSNNEEIYFIVNQRNERFDGWLPLGKKFSDILIYNPMNATSGKAEIRSVNDRTEVYLQLERQETLILKSVNNAIDKDLYPYYNEGKFYALKTFGWKVDFISGGPTLPQSINTDSLVSWTALGKAYENFSGTAQYTTTFDRPAEDAVAYKIDLGTIDESAEVYLNDEYVGTLIGPVYQLVIPGEKIKQTNQLRIVVSNLMANRIANLDREGMAWKKFYNINFPSRKLENRNDGLFNASHWLPVSSGLIGPIRISNLNSLRNRQH